MKLPGLRAGIATLGVASLLLLSATTVSADCAMPPPLAEAVQAADVVFVGSVQKLDNDDRWAQVGVEEIWRGEVSLPTTEVRGGIAPGSATSVDRTYALGTRYLFVLSFHQGRLTDSSCGSTSVWEPALARLRPADAFMVSATAPATASSFDVGSLVMPAIAVVVVGAAVFGLVVAFRPNR